MTAGTGGPDDPSPDSIATAPRRRRRRGGLGPIVVAVLGASSFTAAAAVALEGGGSTYQPAGRTPVPAHPFTVNVPASQPSVASPPPSAVAPDHLVVPSLGIDAPLAPETVASGKLGIPSDVQTVGWWTGGGDIVGTTGTVLLAGHVDWVGQGDGALYPLAGIAPRATVYVSDAAGSVSTWIVTSATSVTKKTLPQTIFDPSGARRLVIVTCGGPFDSATGHYLDNVVVTAEPAPVAVG